ncbi:MULTISPECIES: hypothetical protein [unclassified Agrococcus]|uniref:hypothetical protein n=1 Tax=unclassified Agrococcus TaxID=2615065 RepID=UPI003622D3D4
MTHERPTDDQVGEQPGMLVADVTDVTDVADVADVPEVADPADVADVPEVADPADVVDAVDVADPAEVTGPIGPQPAPDAPSVDPTPAALVEHDATGVAPGARPRREPRGVRAGQRMRGFLHGVAARLAHRRSPAPPRVARVFDGHRDGRPWFAPEHRVVVDRAERDGLLALLRSGSVVVHAARPLRDDLGDHDAAVPASLRSDGTWIWSDASAYYLERHWIAPDAELVAHLRTAGPPAAIDAKTWQRLSAAIRPDAWEGTTWPLD